MGVALTDSAHTTASTGSSFNCGASAVVVVVVVVQPLIYSTPFAPDGIRTRAGAAPMNHMTGRSLGSEVRGRAIAAAGHAGWRMTQPRADDVGFRDSTLAHDWSVLFPAEASLTGRSGRSPSPPLESCLDTVRPLSALPLRNQPQTGTNKGCATATSPPRVAAFMAWFQGRRQTEVMSRPLTSEVRGGLITCVWWCRHGPVSSTSPWLHC